MDIGKKLVAFLQKGAHFSDRPKRIFLLLRCLYLSLGVYYALLLLLNSLVFSGKAYLLCASFLVLDLAFFACTYWLSARANLCLFFILNLLWIVLFVLQYGWNCGAQHLLFPMIGLFFFATYKKLPHKILMLVSLFAIRLSLSWYSQNSVPWFGLGPLSSLLLQTIHSALNFIMTALICGFFSFSVSSAEETLLQYNEELKKQASTDFLTGLLNRRTILPMIEEQAKRKSGTFTICIGDIDFFKKVNDQYGHNMGDEVLSTLSRIFQERMEHGAVCRWGGEEFLFLFPGQDKSEARQIIFGILETIRALEFRHGDQSFHVTMTFGIEEYDFQSQIDDLISRADEKLYIGKQNGRNQIVC